jgi:CHAT domain-containing protein/Tfp pilus assembly protein PilF
VQAARDASDLPGQAAALRLRAAFYQLSGRGDEALRAWREAADAWEKAGDGPSRVLALLGAALLLHPQRPEEAASLLQQALNAGRQESRRPMAAAESLNTAGIEWYNRGGIPQARELFGAALAIRERTAPRSEPVAASLNNLGHLSRAAGEPAAAREYFQRALRLLKELPPNPGFTAVCLANLGAVAHDQGDLATARDYYHQALSETEKGPPNSPEAASSLNSLGVVARHQGDLAAARDYLGRALAIREARSPDSLEVAQSFTNLGTLAVDQGDLAAARRHHEKALEIQRRLAPGSLELARTLANLGNVAAELGEEARAMERYRQALAILEAGSPGSRELAMTLNNLGVVAERTGDLDQAAALQQRALELGERLAPGSLDHAQSLLNLSVVAFRRNDLPRAEQLAAQAWGIVRNQASSVSGDEARQGFGASTARFVSRLVEYQVALGKDREALLTLEQGRAQALQQLLLERTVLSDALGPAWAEYRAAVAARDRAGQALAAASVVEARARAALEAAREETAPPERTAALEAGARQASERLEQLQSAYVQARLKAEQLGAEARKKSPRACPEPPSLEEARKSLPADQLYVAFSTGEKRSLLFLVRGGAAPLLKVHPIPATEAELRELAGRFTRALETRGADATAAARALFNRLFSAEARAAVLGARRLLISPDGPLWNVPFGALVTGATGPPAHLGATRGITYAQSLTLFAQTRREPRRTPASGRVQALVVGDPVFDRKPVSLAAAARTAPAAGERSLLFEDGKPPPRLPGTRREAAEVARLYGAKPLLGEAATETAVRRAIAGADVVHLATHGYFHPHRAMASGILLAAPRAQSGGASEDGALQAWEIMSQLKLRAGLVVLAACDTGRGENVRGEGIVGLTRALQYAGARSILASRWRVSDVHTRALMVEVHAGLRKGLAKDEALRRAAERLRRDPTTAHPYYWAAFFLTGDPS